MLRDPEPADPPAVSAPEAESLLRGDHGEPFSFLGAHPVGTGWIVRCFLPGAESARLLVGDTAYPMTPAHPDGIFTAALPARPGLYTVEGTRGGDIWQIIDPYQFSPILGDMDEHLIGEGAHMRLWRTLGARPCTHDEVEGVAFAVWAPDARRVSVVGDFNAWDGRRHPMRKRWGTGVWEIFLPGLADGAQYKYEVLPSNGGPPVLKADPVGTQGELRPGNCSIVRGLDGFTWHDEAWMSSRAEAHRTDAPVSIYEAHLGSWRRREDGSWQTYRDLAKSLVPYVADLGFTHLEVLPVNEHPFDGSWGYQPVGLFAPTSRFGDLDDFRFLVQACHKAGLGLIIDWVPAHFPEDAHGLARFDGNALYEHADPREGFHPDWNTLIYNFGRTEVQNFLIANALYWVLEHHVDGLRVDAVASMLYRDYSREDGQWIPNKDGGRENLEAIDFLRRMNATVYGTDPSVMTLAEESTAWPGVSRPVHDGGLGFGFKWNMGWMHDTLEYMKVDPLFRRYHHDQMTFGLIYAFSENFVLPLSHDEVVHGKGSLYDRMPGDHWNKLANLRAYYAFMWAHPGKKLLFMGGEFGQRAEWDADASLDWGALQDPLHAGLKGLVRDLNGTYRDLPALHQRDARSDGFQWIDGGAKEASVFAWVRWGEDGTPPVLAVFNFSGAEQTDWRLGVPQGGFWREVLNSDATDYGGAGRGNAGGVTAEPVDSHGQSHSVVLTLPPLTGMYFVAE